MPKKYNYDIFAKKVKDHLGEYKNKVLNINEKGKFLYKGNDYFYDYILPEGCENLNILERYRDDFLKYNQYRKAKLHTYFRHLNSSQAMCINFFFPLIQEKKMMIDIA